MTEVEVTNLLYYRATKKLLTLTVDTEPPSANKMYVHTYRGPRPSDHTKAFKAAAHMEILKQLPFDFPALDPNKGYLVDYTFLMPIKTLGFSTGKAASKYKKKDTSNLIKVLEDVLAECVDIDDSSFLEVRARKIDSAVFSVRIELYELVTL